MTHPTDFLCLKKKTKTKNNFENILKKTKKKKQRLRPAHWADIGQPVLSKLHQIRTSGLVRSKHTTALCGPCN